MIFIDKSSNYDIMKDGLGYKIDFETQKADEFPFDFDIVMI